MQASLISNGFEGPSGKRLEKLVTEAELVATYPRIWHMAADGSWPSIRKHGLLSTRALLELHGVEGEQVTKIVSRRRPA